MFGVHSNTNSRRGKNLWLLVQHASAQPDHGVPPFSLPQLEDEVQSEQS